MSGDWVPAGFDTTIRRLRDEAIERRYYEMLEQHWWESLG